MTVFNQSCLASTAPVASLRRSTGKPFLSAQQTTNYATNNVFAGAVIGTRTMATNWGWDTAWPVNSVDYTVSGVGTETLTIGGALISLPYFELTFSGTPSATFSPGASPFNSLALEAPAAPGDTAVGWYYARQISGSQLSVISSVVPRDAAGASLGSVSSAAVPLTSSPALVSRATTFTNASTALATSKVVISFTNGVAVNAVVRFYAVALEKRAGPGPAISTTTAGAVTVSLAGASALKAVGKIIAATSVAIASCSKASSRSLIASSAAAAILVLQTGKPLLASSAPIATLRSAVGKVLACSSAAVATLIRAASKPFLASSAAVARLSRQAGKPLLASSAAAGQLQLQTGKPLIAASPAIASLGKGSSMALQASSAPIASLGRGIGRAFLASSAPIAFLSRPLSKGLLAVTAPIASIRVVKKIISHPALAAVVGIINVNGILGAINLKGRVD